MGTMATLHRLRAERAARALVEIHRAIDAGVLHGGAFCDDDLERLTAMRELAVIQLERLRARLRHDAGLAAAIEAACRSYRAWSEVEPGGDVEQRAADALSVAVLQLRSALGPLVPRPARPANVLVVGPGAPSAEPGA